MKILTLILICVAFASADKVRNVLRGRGRGQDVKSTKAGQDESLVPPSEDQDSNVSSHGGEKADGSDPASRISIEDSKTKIATNEQEFVAEIFKLFKYPFGNTVIVIITLVVITLTLVGLLKKEIALADLHEQEAAERLPYYNQYYDYYNYNPHYNYRSSKSPFDFSYQGMIDLAQRVYTALQTEY
ncbi:uncharacterized protein [Palaemon carinicauda]|uniref:uncharacterized protein n=1 Tax=Palaemon carinicauda TaxID=392227 RepID=UPI0035B68577